MREGELFGIVLEDFDFDQKVVRVRRQVKRLDSTYVFALPKNDRERIVPLSDWDIQIVRRHIQKYPPRSYVLPWERPGGRSHACSILFRWPTDDQHVKARSYSETVWKAALVKAGVITEPARDRRGRRRYVTTRKEGIHQLRHYYASVMLAGGVSIKELAGIPRPQRSGLHVACLCPYAAVLPRSCPRGHQRALQPGPRAKRVSVVISCSPVS